MGRFNVFTNDYQLTKHRGFGKNSFTGQINGYYTVITIEESRYSRNMYITIGASIEAPSLATAVEEIKNNFRVSDVKVEEHTIQIHATPRVRTAKFKEQVTGIMKTVTAQLESLSASSGCFISGVNDDTIELMKIDGEFTFLTSDAYEDLANKFEAIHAKDENKRGRLVLGLVGALIGSLLGALIWGILLYFGYYGWFAAVIGVIAAFYLYQKFGGPINITGAIGIIIILISTLLIANRAVYTYIIATIFKQLNWASYSYGDIFINLESLLAEFDAMLIQAGEAPAYVNSFRLDNWLGIGVSMIFGIIYFIVEYRKAKSKNTVERLG